MNLFVFCKHQKAAENSGKQCPLSNGLMLSEEFRQRQKEEILVWTVFFFSFTDIESKHCESLLPVSRHLK